MRFRPYISGLFGAIQAPVYLFIRDPRQQLRMYEAFTPHGLDSTYNHQALEFLQQVNLYVGDYISMSSVHSYAAVRLPDESYVVIGPLVLKSPVPASKGPDVRQSKAQHAANPATIAHPTNEETPLDNLDNLDNLDQLDRLDRLDRPVSWEQAAQDAQAAISPQGIHASQIGQGQSSESCVGAGADPGDDSQLLQLKLRTVNLWCEMVCQIVVRQELLPENEAQIYNAADDLIPQHLKKIAKEIKLKAPHNQYRYELATLDAIRNGDVDKVERSFSIPLKGKFGILASDPLRSMQNHVHNISTLASRAAISAGILPERAFALSDKFFMASEECKTIEQCFELRRLCARSFAQMVKEYRLTKQQELNPLVRDIKLIISRELFNRFSVQDLAERLNHSYEHLERIFKEHTGLSLATYIRQEKLKQAQELMRDTPDSIADIAHMLGFESASHFSRVFKSYCGLTPRQYRKVFSSEHVG